MLSQAFKDLNLPYDVIARRSCGSIAVFRLYAPDLAAAWHAAKACKENDAEVVGLVCAADV